MAKSPSKRTHRIRPPEGLNLTPFIDMITCLMFFLLMFAGIIPVVTIDAPLPKVASNAEEVKQAKDSENKMEVTVVISSNGFSVKADIAKERAIGKTADGKYDYAELHKHLIALHKKKPNSHEITLMPNDDVTYDVMVEVMDAARELVKGDEGYQTVSPEIAGSQERVQFNRMFSDVSIGGV
jgi:biopolymer transport protein TolR